MHGRGVRVQATDPWLGGSRTNYEAVNIPHLLIDADVVQNFSEARMIPTAPVLQG